MHFCKINIHISNVINTFLSLLLTVVRVRCSGGWRRTYASRAPLRYASLESLFTGAKEAKFLYFSKGKCSWLISKSSDIFLYKSLVCTSNSCLAFCFVLSPRSSLITQRRRPTLSTCTASTYNSQRKWEKSVYYVWNKTYFNVCWTVDQCDSQCGSHSPPELCEPQFIMDARALFNDCCTETPADCNDRA